MIISQGNVCTWKTTLELVHKEKNPGTKCMKQENCQFIISCLSTNADIVTKRIPELKAQIPDHSPVIVTITEVLQKKYRFRVQEIKLKISNDFDDLTKKGQA